MIHYVLTMLDEDGELAVLRASCPMDLVVDMVSQEELNWAGLMLKAARALGLPKAVTVVALLEDREAVGVGRKGLIELNEEEEVEAAEAVVDALNNVGQGGPQLKKKAVKRRAVDDDDDMDEEDEGPCEDVDADPPNWKKFSMLIHHFVEGHKKLGPNSKVDFLVKMLVKADEDFSMLATPIVDFCEEHGVNMFKMNVARFLMLVKRVAAGTGFTPEMV